MSLTREQLEVVHHEGSHALVGAVAGSGKTRTLIARIVHRLQRGIDPKRMLILMFNRSAMEDFSLRMKQETQQHILPAPQVRTFHAFGQDVCKALEKRGLIPTARLITKEYELRKIMRQVLDKVNTRLSGPDQFDTSNPEVLATALAMVDSMKNTLVMFNVEQWKKQPPKWCDVYATWESRRIDGVERFRSFTDLIFDPVNSMREDDKIHDFVTNHYDEILIDEMQDICPLQMAFVQHVAGTRAKIVAVGDEDQTIYGFRAAKPEFMLHLFERIYTDTKRFTLSASFRYGHQVALLANNSIQHNKQRTDKICVSAARHQTDVKLVMTGNNQPHHEVIKALQAWKASGRRLAECAVLVREFSHGSLTETAFMQASIPYRLVGAAPFFERREILAMRAALTIATDRWHQVPTDELRQNLIESLLTVPPLYLKRNEMDPLVKMAMASEKPHEVLLQAITVKLGSTKGYAGRHYDVFCRHIKTCSTTHPTKPAAQFLRSIIQTLDLATVFMASEVSSQAAHERLQLLQAFTSIAQQGNMSIADFHDLITNLSAKIGKGGEDDSVLLTSIHRTKGLEFAHVIIPELSDKRFPSDHDNMEDERRLFYVAVTRAIEQLTLIVPYDPPLVEWIKGRNHGFPVTELKASRFIYESSPMLAKDAAAAICNDAPFLTPDIIGTDSSGHHRAHLARYIDMHRDFRESQDASQENFQSADQESVSLL